jgi:hypothetical protein
MSSAHDIALRLIEEGTNARAHFQIWWALRNLALPKYLPAMNNMEYVDFFHAANSGHYVLFFLALSKIFDRDPRVAGISELKRTLRAEGKTKTAIEIARQLKPVESYVKRVMRIRNRSVVHNEHAVPRNKVYQVNGITPNQLREVIDAACSSINAAARELGITNTVFESDRAERATLNLLEALDRARA